MIRTPRFVGMVHLLPLPGSPAWSGDFRAVLAAAVRDAETLAEGGVDAVLVENWGDAPFHPDRVAPETVAAMARVVGELAGRIDVPLGVNCLRNDARSALALCATGEASFLRVNVHTGATVTDQGLVEGRAWETVRERTRLAPAAAIYADVQVKHGRPLVQRPLEEEAKDTATRGRADALILSGVATGDAPDVEALRRVRAAVPDTPLLVGSGLSVENAERLMRFAEGAIVGTSLKVGGVVEGAVDLKKVRALRAVL